MLASFDRHTARFCQPLAVLCVALAFASGCDVLLSIEEPARTIDAGIGEKPAPDGDGGREDAASMCAKGCCPDCAGAMCGSDGCGGSCGYCDEGEVCTSAQTCVVMRPLPECTGTGMEVEFCDELPELRMATPRIDGVADCDALLKPIKPAGWTESVGEIPPGFAARYSAAWLETGLYVYVEVDVGSATTLDPAPVPDPSAIDAPYYCGDSVEIDVVLDGRPRGDYYRVPGGGQVVVRAPEGNVTGHTAQSNAHIGEGDDWTESRTLTDPQTIGAFPRPGGYTVEAWITAAAVGDWGGSLTAGQRIGFDIGINVAAPPGTPDEQIDGEQHNCPMLGRRLGQFYRRTATRPVPGCPNGDPWCTPAALCSPELR
jgi:hypothetical protein